MEYIADNEMDRLWGNKSADDCNNRITDDYDGTELHNSTICREDDSTGYCILLSDGWYLLRDNYGGFMEVPNMEYADIFDSTEEAHECIRCLWAEGKVTEYIDQLDIA